MVVGGNIKRFGLLLIVFLLAGNLAGGQSFAIKTNIISDATATINLGAEVRLAPRWSLDISGNYNAWEFGDYRKQKQWNVKPEGRFWLCEAFNGHFFGLHAIAGEYNMAAPFFPFSLIRELQGQRYEGWQYGVGAGYGYHWILSPRWSIEAEAGIGWMGSKYSQYECYKCGKLTDEGFANRFAITRLSVSVVFMIF